MTYWPSEADTGAAVSWPSRRQAWPHYKPETRQRLIEAPKKFATVMLDDDELKGNANAEAVAEWMYSPERRDAGLLLMGPPGRGKTRLACAVANEYSEAGGTTKFITAPTLHKMSLTLMQLEKNKDADSAVYAEIIEGYSTGHAWDLLVLDDMGRERSTGSDYSEHLIEELMRNRYDEGALTVATTNLDRQGIEARYGSRMSSLIEEMFWIVGVTGPDWRRA